MKKRDLSAKTFFLRYELLLFACVFLLIIGILAYTNYSYLDLCQYFEHKKLKGYADFFNSSSSFCCGVI